MKAVRLTATVLLLCLMLSCVSAIAEENAWPVTLTDAGWAEISYEQLLQWDPDAVIIAAEARYTGQNPSAPGRQACRVSDAAPYSDGFRHPESVPVGA